MTDIDVLVEKSVNGTISDEEITILEKGRKDFTELVRKTVVDESGKTAIKWVKPSESKDPDKS